MRNLLLDPTALPRRPERLGIDAQPTFEPGVLTGHPKLDRLHRYWTSKRQGDRLPGRSDIDPADIPELLPFLGLIDVLRDPMRFRYRLWGTELVYWLGADPTGKLVDEIGLPQGERDLLVSFYGRPVSTREPACIRGTHLLRDGRLRSWESVLLPLAADGANVDMLLGIMILDTN